VVAQNIPMFIFIKASMVTASVYLLDIATRNPVNNTQEHSECLFKALFLDF
jgi:hypothetical protein